MTLTDKLRELIAAGEKATPRPWYYEGASRGFALSAIQGVVVSHPQNGPYTAQAANLAPALARFALAALEFFEDNGDCWTCAPNWSVDHHEHAAGCFVADLVESCLVAEFEREVCGG